MTASSGARILDVIEWLASHGRAATLAETSAALDLPKSSTLVLLRTLVEAGYAGRGEDGRYRLLRLPGEASADSGAWGTIVRITDEFARDAVAQTQESGFIAVLTPERRIRYLSKHLPAREIRYDRNIAIDRIAHHVASGVAMLAAMSDADIDDYLAAASRAGALKGDERDAVARAIATARRNGVAVNLRGRVEGASGVAAAIVDATGRPVAALNISGPSDRVEAHLDHIAAATKASAHLASQSLARRLALPKDDGRRAPRTAPGNGTKHASVHRSQEPSR
jgi:IclR family transcriptional regulator, acetate operon repressor